MIHDEFDYVPQDVAEALIEKGYDTPGYACYTEMGTLREVFPARLLRDECLGRITAPTISDSLNWLRRKKMIYITISCASGRYCYEIDCPQESYKGTESYEMFELATIEAIKMALRRYV